MLTLEVYSKKTYTAEFRSASTPLLFTTDIIHQDHRCLINSLDIVLTTDFMFISPARIRFYAIGFVYSWNI